MLLIRRRVIRTIAMALSLTTLAIGMFFVVIGQPGSTVGEDSGTPATTFRRSFVGLIPSIGAAFVIAGLSRKWPSSLAWIGLIILTGFSGLFVFGIGSWFLLPTILLWILVLGATWPRSPPIDTVE